MKRLFSAESELTRRGFIKTTGKCALGAVCGGMLLKGLALDAFGADAAAGDKVTAIEADKNYWSKGENNLVTCALCPNVCVLKPGQVSYCRTRRNHDGVLFTHAYNNPCILTLDPVEKIPFYHFMPGSGKALVVATAGCNLHCTYCQNWEQSQAEPDKLKNFHVTPEEAVKGAATKKCVAIAYTYTDPMAFYEYGRDIARLAKDAGLPTLFGTAAYLHPKPMEELCKYASAFAVTLKGFNEAFYRKVTGVKLAPVLKSLETIRKSGPWLELVNLILPTVNDDPNEMREMCKWIKTNLGEDTPLHFEQFSPLYRLKDLPRTPISTLEEARGIAQEAGLKFAYISNYSPHDGNQTTCPKCKAMLIRRLGFTVLENRVKGGSCPDCGTKVPGVWPTAEQEAAAAKDKAQQSTQPALPKWVCPCGYVYDPAKNNNVPFESLPGDWKCPACGAAKSKFRKME